MHHDQIGAVLGHEIGKADDRFREDHILRIAGALVQKLMHLHAGHPVDLQLGHPVALQHMHAGHEERDDKPRIPRSDGEGFELAEIGAGQIPQVLVFNKIDRIEGAVPRRDPEVEGRERVWLSAKTGDGLDGLRELLTDRFLDRRVAGELALGPAQGRLRARLHEVGAVKTESSDETGWRLHIDLPRAVAERLAAEPGGDLLAGLLLVAPAAPTYNPETN